MIDYAAMDIKAGPAHYAKVCGLSEEKTADLLEKVDQSIKLLKNSAIPYEFRTTAVRGLHDDSDFLEIREWISGCKYYYLQNFRDCPEVLLFCIFAKGNGTFSRACAASHTGGGSARNLTCQTAVCFSQTLLFLLIILRISAKRLAPVAKDPATAADAGQLKVLKTKQLCHILFLRILHSGDTKHVPA